MRRKSSQRSAIWPYLAVLACLFVLSVTAPRAWERMGRDTDFDREVERRSIAAGRRATPANEVESAARPTHLLAKNSPQAASGDRGAPVETDPSTASGIGRLAPRQAIDREWLAGGAESPSAEAPLAASEATSLAEPQATRWAPELTVKTADTSADEPEPASAPSPNEPAPSAEPDRPSSDALAVDVPEAPEKEEFARPAALVEQFKQLAADRRTGNWANLCVESIEATWPKPPRGPAARDADELKLRRLAERDLPLGNSPKLSGPIATSKLTTQVARARYALNRWLDIREAAGQLDAPTARSSKTATQQIVACLAAIDALTMRGISGGEWRDFLMVDKLRLLTSEVASPEARRAAARRVLDHLNSPRLTLQQHKFIAERPIVNLRTALTAWAAEAVPPEQVLADVERYERSGLPSDARRVANDLRGLRWSDVAGAAHASEQLDTHYRNANVRVTMSASLMNRLVPQRGPMESAVYDTVANVPVYGNSTTKAKAQVLLIPDPNRIRIGLEIDGQVDSNTVAASGPAKFYNQGRSTFVVHKLFLLGPYGLTVFPAAAGADASGNYLVSMDTEYDGMPIIGKMARNIARTKHDEQSQSARAEVEQKIATRARTQLDSEIGPRLTRMVNKFETNQLALLDRLGLELVPIEMATTRERVVARMRLGSPEQLGAHTPRPRDPADSWFSLELEQSALNNYLERLDLDGRTFELADLFRWLAKKMKREQPANLDELPEGVRLKFAEHDAVRIRAAQDRIELTLSFAELTQDSRRFTDFSVRTTFQPEIRAREAVFVRDSAISLDGKNLKGRAKVPLYTIFSKVFARKREFQLLDEKMTHDLRLSDLAITQFEVADGWISLAYGTNRVARKLPAAKADAKAKSTSLLPTR